MQAIKLQDLNHIPEDVLRDVIHPFIPLSIRSMLTKQDYNSYYPTFIEHICANNQLDSYTRSLIRKEQTLPFKLLINIRYNIWEKIKNFRSKIGNVALFKCPNYIVHLKELCNHYNSNACKTIIINYEKSNGKKIHKKIKFKNIRWSN